MKASPKRIKGTPKINHHKLNDVKVGANPPMINNAPIIKKYIIILHTPLRVKSN